MKKHLTLAVTQIEAKVPADLSKALLANSTSKAKWDDLTPIARRDFIRWIETAKLPETRQRRIDRVGPMLKSGKRRPCCYAIMPMNLYRALGANAKSKKTWSSLTPDERRDFVAWIDSAKESATHGIRIEETIGMLAAGRRKP